VRGLALHSAPQAEIDHSKAYQVLSDPVCPHMIILLFTMLTLVSEPPRCLRQAREEEGARLRHASCPPSLCLSS
jgi:hypothetical protein